MKKIINWVMAVILVICGEAVFTACSSDNGDNPVGDNSLTEMIVGKWIHTDTDGEAVTTDMKSVYTFTKDGAVLKGHYSMSMTESGVWSYNQETDVTISGNTITMTSLLADGVISVVELTDVSVSSDDLRFTAKTTLSKDGQVTATYGPRQEHFTKVDADYTEAVVGLWEITFTSDDPEHESSEPYRELYRADGTASFYDLIDGQWVEEETTYSEYFADGPLFCFRWQKPGQEGRHENWEIVSCTDNEMVNKAFHRRADGSTYTITAHLKKVEKFDDRKYALVDLHLHLDGSLSVDDAIYMASVDGVSLPASRSEIETLLVCPEDCESLNDYLKCFDLPVSIMQSSTTIAYSVKSLVKRLDEQGLIYAEIRYAPQLHLQKGLTMDEVTAASIEGLKAGMAESSHGIKAQLILCCMRGEGNDELNMQTVDVAKKYLGQGVCAIDIAGAEALYPTSKYRELFAYAKTQGVPFTIHAGEADGVESMKLAVEYGAKRIGHGVRAFDDAEMKQLLIQNDICLTLCPTSNLQTKALAGVTRMSQYPLQTFIADGVPVCINTDNMSVSNTTVQKEMKKLYDAGILTAAQAELMVRTAITHAFPSDTEKSALLSKIK